MATEKEAKNDFRNKRLKSISYEHLDLVYTLVLCVHYGIKILRIHFQFIFFFFRCQFFHECFLAHQRLKISV
jgi:hypothetical protein